MSMTAPLRRALANQAGTLLLVVDALEAAIADPALDPEERSRLHDARKAARDGADEITRALHVESREGGPSR
jgi:hypothetical protein